MRAAVIGVGRMGRNHVRVGSEETSVELVAIADASATAVRDIGERYDVKAYTSAEEMLRREHPELVVVAVPTSLHVEIGVAALRAGAHVLLEKPIASDARGARRLIAAAASARRQLHIGHIERFNPAVTELARRIHRGEAGRVMSVHSRRLSSAVGIKDAGVILDLASHDLDIMRYLLRTEPRSVWSVSRRHRGGDHEDWAMATLEFDGGTVGMLEVNWLTPKKVRTLTVLGDRGMFALDYVSQELRFHERASVPGQWQGLTDLVTGGAEGAVVQVPIAHIEPLRAEWEAVVKAIRSRTRPVVSGEDGLRTLDLALALLRSANTGRPVALRAS